MRRSSSLRLVGLVLFLAATQALHAQLNRGVLEGVVTDPQGAVMPAVAVTITNVETNITAPSKTNSSGYYRAENLVPGKYSAHFEFSGFSPLGVTDIEILAGRVIRVDAQMKVGASLQTVEVSGTAALIETAATNASTTLERRIVEELPLSGRDLQTLVNLMPGVNNVGGPPGSTFGFNSAYGTFPDPIHMLGSDLSVNGGQASANAWYLDGNLNLTGFAENVAVSPTPDAVSEFQAITNAFSAEYGRTGGAVFNVVLKSGTNAVHGNIYEFLRNDATNARNPFTSIDSLGHVIKDRQLRFNNFGGTVGGPVVLPHIYNGKDRTFFFFSFDQTNLHLLGNRVFTVPTQLQQQGNFSEDPNVIQYGMWDPRTTVGPDANGLFLRTALGTPVLGNPFGADGCLNTSVEAGAASGTQTCNFATQIPAARLDPVANFFMKSFPAPNYLDPLSDCPISADGVTGLCNNFLGTIGSSQRLRNISLKVDHKWSDKSSYFGEWLFSPGKYNNYRVPWKGATFPYVGFGSAFPVDTASTIIALGHTYVLSPSLINEFRASYSRQFITSNPDHPYPDSITDQSQVAQTLASLKLPLDPTNPIYDIGFDTPAGGSISFGPTPYANLLTVSDAWTILDNITKTMGRHTLKGGVMYRINHDAYVSPFTNGLNFGGLVVDPTTGLGATGLTEFMMGETSGGGAGKWFQPYARSRYWGVYFQDEFRVTPNFTLNLGLRYDIYGIIKLRPEAGPESRMCLTCSNPTTGLNGKIEYWGDPGFPAGSDVWPPNWSDLGPRINFAWSPFADHKTTFRGGYDIFYTNAFTGLNAPGQGSSSAIPGYINFYGWSDSWYPGCQRLSGQCVIFPLSDTTADKAALLTPPYIAELPGQLRSQLPGFYFQWLQKPNHDPMMQMWNFEVQRELPGDIMLSVGYVGSHGTHLLGEPFRSFSYVHTADKLKYRNAINSQVPITDFYSGFTAEQLGNTFADPLTGQPATELPLSQLLTPYPFWYGIPNNTSFDGTSIYHSLAVRLQKRYASGLSFVAAYTYSKNIVNASTSSPTAFPQDPFHAFASGVVGGRAGHLSGLLGGNYQDIDNRKADRAVASSDIPQIFNLAVSYELPFGRGKHFLTKSNRALNGVLGGWRLSGNFNAQGGVPLSIRCPGNELTGRCNLIGDPHFSGKRTKEQQINQWINPAAFQPPFGGDESFWANYDPTDDRAWQFGNSDTRIAQLRAPGFWNLDTALAKEFRLTESKRFEFRWEAFNALNHQNLAIPNTGFCLPPLPDGTTDRVHQSGCQFGRITNIATDPRAMEFALKFIW